MVDMMVALSVRVMVEMMVALTAARWVE